MNQSFYVKQPGQGLGGRGLLVLLLLAVSTASIAQTGYIYLHKKALDESSSTNFTLNVSGGPTAVPTITLNDNPTFIDLKDIGASQNGTLWALSEAGGLYYRAATSSTWIASDFAGGTGVVRVDGAQGGFAFAVLTDGSLWRVAPVGFPHVQIGSPIAGAYEAAADWAGNYWTASAGVLYRSTGGAFTAVNSGAINDVASFDVNPVTGDAVVIRRPSASADQIWSITPAGVATNLGKPAGSRTALDVGVDGSGNIYASFNSTTDGDPYVYKWLGGTTWSAREDASRLFAVNLTGGPGAQMWGVARFTPTGDNIVSRATDGTTIYWLDDERVRTTPANGNSEFIAVAPGTYTITETVPGGWNLQDIQVYDPSNNSSFSVSGQTATVTVGAGETVNVVYENGVVNPFALVNNCSSTFTENFGTGPAGSFGPPFVGQTSYHYLGDNTGSNEGYYKIAGNSNTLFGGAVNMRDHTAGDGLGRMLLVDAGTTPDVFFRRRFSGLVVGASYRFSAWVANVNPFSGTILPNVTFKIIDAPSSATLASNNTGNIPVGSGWVQYGLNFTATSTEIDLVLNNNAGGGRGNDLAIDDISFGLTRPLQPVVSVTNPNCTTTTTGTVTVNSPLGASIEYSINGTTYQSSPTFTAVAPGSYSVTARFTNSVGCVSTPASISVNACPQPVSLVSFTAQAQADRTVLLNWKTSWESANKAYRIERSKDLKSFEQIGEITDVAGTSNSINSYKFVDKAPYRGTSYYRLVQLDVDGSQHTYKAEPVVIEGRYGVYPNPVSGHSFTLELDEPASAVLHLYDVGGREVSVSKSDVTELSLKVSPSAQLSTGVYVLTVEERGTLRRHRLVVQ